MIPPVRLVGRQTRSGSGIAGHNTRGPNLPS